MEGKGEYEGEMRREEEVKEKEKKKKEVIERCGHHCFWFFLFIYGSPSFPFLPSHDNSDKIQSL
jgi:hypothetical protein